MAGTTEASTTINDLATQLTNLVTSTTITDFNNLGKFTLNAGNERFDAAQWLEAVVKDRRAGMIEHVKYLQTVFTGLGEALRTVASTLLGTDSDGAASIAALNKWIDGANQVDLPKVNPLFASGQTSYNNSNDAKGDAYLVYQVDPGGHHVVDGSGQVHIDTPDWPAGTPSPYDQVWKELGTYFTGSPPPPIEIPDGKGFDPNAPTIPA